jgi:L-lactate dehydrogenase complex protein LldG
MNRKNEILDRLRQVTTLNREMTLSPWQDKDLFNHLEGNSDDLTTIFKHQFEKLSGEIYIVKSEEEAAKKLHDLLENIEPQQCRTHNFPLISALKKINPEIADYLAFADEQDISSEEFANFEVGVSGADCLIARTGSILLRAISAGGRRLSVLPPVHIVISLEKQIVASLDEAIAFLDTVPDTWGYATIISGPSRTSDIEKQLVLGAHGPKKLIVILIKN